MAIPSDAAYLNPQEESVLRADDLLARMTLTEKAGLLFHDMLLPQPDVRAPAPAGWNLLSAADAILGKQMNHFNLVGPINDAKAAAQWYNDIQKLAEETRLRIPVTISSDPRNHFTDNVGTSAMAGIMSQWPEPFGLAALRDPALVQRFADIVRKEYCAVGIRVALHPQLDLCTEYRWARAGSTFGEDANLTTSLAVAYMKGLQKTSFGDESVSAMIKHFPGGGPQANNGEDAHFLYGQDQAYPAGMFDYHLTPFKAIIDAGARQMMPYYSKPVGTQYEEVGFAFNKGIITDLLQNQLGYTGIVCSDWGLITDSEIMGQPMPARAWGAQNLTELQRLVKILNAGVDQFGGEHRPELVVQAVEQGLIPEHRIDESCRKLLVEKFELGLFDDKRYVDIDKAKDILQSPASHEAGRDAQRRSCTLLKNANNILPLCGGDLSKKFYLEGADPKIARQRGLTIVDNPSEADIAILRLKAPFEKRDGGFEAYFHAGSLDFPEADISHHQEIFDKVPQVIVDVYLDRPAVLTHLERATTLLVNFGVCQECFFDVLLGCIGAADGKCTGPEGKLPFDLPRSMKAVQDKPCDQPFGTKDPLFKFGHGLRYERE